LVSFDRSDISTHQEWVLLLLKVRFRIEFFDFLCMGVVSSGSKIARNFVLVRGYILLLFMSISVANSRQIF
jgi:hypothetical protein